MVSDVPRSSTGGSYGRMLLIGKKFTRVGGRFAGLSQNTVLLHILGELFWQFFSTGTAKERRALKVYTTGAVVLYFRQQPRAPLEHLLARADLQSQPFLPENGCFKRLWESNGHFRYI